MNTRLQYTVNALLGYLANEIEGYNWQTRCTYSDGKGKTILEIHLFSGPGKVLVGQIAWQLETGEVLSYTYQTYQTSLPLSIVDLLLDILNLERIKTMKTLGPGRKESA